MGQLLLRLCLEAGKTQDCHALPRGGGLWAAFMKRCRHRYCLLRLHKVLAQLSEDTHPKWCALLSVEKLLLYFPYGSLVLRLALLCDLEAQYPVVRIVI